MTCSCATRYREGGSAAGLCDSCEVLDRSLAEEFDRALGRYRLRALAAAGRLPLVRARLRSPLLRQTRGWEKMRIATEQVFDALLHEERVEVVRNL